MTATFSSSESQVSMSRTLVRVLVTTLVLGAITAAAPSFATAQDGPTLIRQGIRAFEEDFDVPRAITLLRRGVNPMAGQQDSLWQAGVQLLAQLLFDEGDQAQSSLWARWSMRIMPTMRLDSVNLVSDVLQAFTTARAQAAAGPGDAVTQTTWTWPTGDLTGTTGTAQVRSTTVPSGLEVLVVGRGLVPIGQGLPLPAGTYEFQASAPGFGPARVTREVLPSVTTILTFNLQAAAVAAAVPDSMFPGNASAAALAQVGRLTVTRYGVPDACAAGFLAGANGLVLTTYSAIRGGDNVTANVGGRTITSGVQVAAYDVDRNIAVLKLPIPGGDSLRLAGDARDGQFVFPLAFPACGSTAASGRTRVAGRAGGQLNLRDTVAGADQGAPLVDQTGAVIALAGGGNRAIPIATAQSVLNDARRNAAAGAMFTPGQVARRESHIYGSAQITSSLTGASVSISPLSDHHWPELARTALLPLTYAGPMGDYSIEVRHQNRVVQNTRMTIRPAEQVRVIVGGQVATAQSTGVPQRGGGGGFPLPLLLLGGAAAAAGIVLAMGGGGSTTVTPPPTTTSPGTITIGLPIP